MGIKHGAEGANQCPYQIGKCSGIAHGSDRPIRQSGYQDFVYHLVDINCTIADRKWSNHCEKRTDLRITERISTALPQISPRLITQKPGAEGCIQPISND